MHAQSWWKEEGGRRRGANARPLLKSRDPHLAGGEKGKTGVHCILICMCFWHAKRTILWLDPMGEPVPTNRHKPNRTETTLVIAAWKKTIKQHVSFRSSLA